MSTWSLPELHANLSDVVREIAHSQEEVIIIGEGEENAVIISVEDYERLHEHADMADSSRNVAEQS